MLTHLQRLEADSIHIIREAVAESERPVMLYSVGKDSAVMLHLALKAFYPARLPLRLVQAGLDSVAGMLGYFFHHLATHPADRRRIAEHPETIPAATEEMLRAFSFIVTGRKAVTDTEIAGCPVAAGSMVQIVLKMSGRDDTCYGDAGTVDLDRGTSSHLAFGAGPHRCLGSHLARRELRAALEEWHRVIPDYRLGEGEPIVEFGRSSGVNTLPLTWQV